MTLCCFSPIPVNSVLGLSCSNCDEFLHVIQLQFQQLTSKEAIGAENKLEICLELLQNNKPCELFGFQSTRKQVSLSLSFFRKYHNKL